MGWLAGHPRGDPHSLDAGGRGAAGTICWLVALAAVARAEPPLQSLAREAGAGQGVYVEAGDGTVLVAQAETRAVHPASVSKVPTSLALLERLGPTHRFTTRVLAAGAVRDGRLPGPLVVDAGGDPFLVSEGAFLVLRRLHALGLREVRGLSTRGHLIFNWQPDPDGARLLRTLRGLDGQAAWAAVDGDERLADVALRLAPAGRAPAAGDPEPLVVYRSPPLLHVVKVLNGHSNNVFHYACDAIGGPGAVEASARAAVPAAMRDEIVLDNGAGMGTTNRLSPRAAVALLRALARALEREGHRLVDALPVSGVDPGTLQDRLLDHPRLVVGKTGTFGSVGASALAGALRTRRYGTTTFAVLNHGVPVPEARARQDAFVRALADATDAEPWSYDVPTRPAYLGAIVE